MNVALDVLLRRAVRDPGFLSEAEAEPELTAEAEGVPLPEVRAMLAGDLLALHSLGAHPLLIMQLAGKLGLDAMGLLSRQPSGED